MQKNNFTTPEWVASGQAKKMKKQVKENAEGVIIKVFYIDDDGRQFCKLEKIYNVDELEPMQKIENTNDFKSLVKKLKAV